MDQVKQAFSTELVESLKKSYGGKMPSSAAIARDFSLKAPHLPHISTETVRKWIRGETLPHVSRMNALIDWLGPQLAMPFEQPIKALQLAKSSNGHVTRNHNSSGHNGQGNGHSNDQPDAYHPLHDELISIIDRLNEKECKSILAIARLLANKHNDED